MTCNSFARTRQTKGTCPYYEVVGDNIRAIRIKLGMSQYRLSKQIGMSPTYIASVENKSTRPNEFLVALCAQVLGCTYEELVKT